MSIDAKGNKGISNLVLLLFVIYLGIFCLIIFKGMLEYFKIWLFLGIILLIMVPAMVIVFKNRTVTGELINKDSVKKEKEQIYVSRMHYRSDLYLGLQRFILLSELVMIIALVIVLILKNKGIQI